MNITQDSFTVNSLQTPITFDLPEDISRRLYVGSSNTARGNILASPGLYYNDISGKTTVVPYFLRREVIGEEYDTYWIRFSGSELTTNSKLTDCQWVAVIPLK